MVLLRGMEYQRVARHMTFCPHCGRRRHTRRLIVLCRMCGMRYVSSRVERRRGTVMPQRESRQISPYVYHNWCRHCKKYVTKDMRCAKCGKMTRDLPRGAGLRRKREVLRQIAGV